MKQLSYKTFRVFIICYTCLVFLIGCGGEKAPGVTANFTGDGYSLYVEQVTVNTYKFTVVENEKHKGAIFTVYGLVDENQIGNFTPSTRMRLAHVADGHQPGDSFEVTFHADDSVFIIYQDALFQGSFIYDTNIEMIRGLFRQ